MSRSAVEIHPGKKRVAFSDVSVLMIIVVLSFSLVFFLSGCGGSQPQVIEEETGLSSDEELVENADGEAEAEEDTTATEELAPESVESQPAEQLQPPVNDGPSAEELQKEIDLLKTENNRLQNRVSSSDESNKKLAAQISDLESALTAAQEKSLRTPPAHELQTTSSSPEQVQRYESAVTIAKLNKFSDGIRQFQKMLSMGIGTDYQDNCYYWIGLCYYGLRKYAPAIENFNKVLTYTKSEKADDALMMLGNCYARTGNWMKANTEYRKLIDEFPASEYASKARAKIK